MIKLFGIGISPGIAIGKAYIYIKQENIVPCYRINNTEKEIERFHKGIEEAKKELSRIKEKSSSLSKSYADIFIAHIMLLDDVELRGEIEHKIKEEQKNAECIIKQVSDRLVNEFLSVDDDIIRERAIDLRDIANRVIDILLGRRRHKIAPNEPSILIADKLTPSDTVGIPKDKILAIAVETGGTTSHTSIIARSLRIPAVVGIRNLVRNIKNSDIVIINGFEGSVIISPDDQTINHYKEIKEGYYKRKQKSILYAKEPAITKDGVKIDILGNADLKDDTRKIIEAGGEGIGLLRTELLFLNRDDYPEEEEQFNIYKEILSSFEGREVVIRTADIGGDKLPKYIQLPKEQNPFLGKRGIRLSLYTHTFFKTQITALYRSSIYGNLKIMFPMITNIEEVYEIRALIDEVKKELAEKKIPYKDVPIGIMVEVPSTAIIIEHFAELVDFVSIGTNDLVQYTLAVDRGNESVSYLYDPYHPAILRLIQQVAIFSSNYHIPASVCGEVASDVYYVPILLGLGIRKLSIAPIFIPDVKQIIRNTSIQETKELMKKVMSLKKAEEIRLTLKNFVDRLL
jgi:phosphotransferase system enzyme I (PtsI)